MKGYTTLITILLIVITFNSTAQTSTNCDVKSLKTSLKEEVGSDYRYDASNITSFTYSSSIQGKQIEVPLFKDQKYKLIFNINDANRNFQIYISYEKAGDENRTNIFALKDVRKEGQNIYVFEPKVSKPVYITYIIPPSVESTETSCVVFMLGYTMNTF